MNEFEQKKLDIHIKKLVSNARAIVTNQIGIPLGILKMTKIIYWIDRISKLENINLNLFDELYKSISDFPLGSERLHCNKEYLTKQDKELNKIILENYDLIIDKCFEIINKFEVKR